MSTELYDLGFLPTSCNNKEPEYRMCKNCLTQCNEGKKVIQYEETNEENETDY